MPFPVLTVHSPLGNVPPVEPGQTYVFTVPVSTRAGHVHEEGTQLLVVAETPACPHDEISATGHNWICSTQHGASVWATLEQCISRGLLRLVPPPKALNQVAPEVTRLVEALRAEFPDVVVTVDGPPLYPDGVWWVDVTVGERLLSATWSQHGGFALYVTQSEGYGEGPDEIPGDYDAAWARLRACIGEALVS